MRSREGEAEHALSAVEGSEPIPHSALRTPHSIAIVAGDLSGDASGGALAFELARQCPGISLWGAGGPGMRDEGVEILADFSSASGIGLVQSLKVAPRLLREFAKLKKAFLQRRPDVFVPIDFGAFNVRLGRFARKQGIPVIYWFPPGSWRKRPRDQSSLLAAADKIITPFPWSADLLTQCGADAVFLGHPMLDWVGAAAPRKALLETIGVRKDVRLIGLLPGSRTHEIINILPALIEASWQISEAVPDAAFVIPASSEQAMREIQRTSVRYRNRYPRPVTRVVLRATYDVMAHSELLITCSGTATLEATIIGTPMVIVYRGSRAMGIEYLLRRRILEQFIGMPNIIAGREICPELLGNQASPEGIAKLAVSLLQKPEELQSMRQELQAARETLGKRGGTARAAKLILETAGLLPKA